MVTMLNRMLWRDLWHLRGQVVAAALVVACGIAILVATQGTYRSLLMARDDYYLTHRLADVFAHLKRAPEALAEEVRQLPGVAQVRTRIVVDVSVDVPGLTEPAVARLVSVPGERTSMLNDLQIVRGRYIDAGATDQVLISEAFAKANQLDVGHKLGALLHGRWKELVIVGIALSPEFVYEVGSGMLFPDNQRFGVMWMDRQALAPAFDMQGAFNDLALSLAAGASEREVVAALDTLLRRYGGLSAYGRAEQLSHRFLTDELGELEVMTTTIPSLFLAVSAFLLYVVLSRLIATQRTQIGLLKAFGYTDLRVGLHYLYLALATVLMGLVLALPLGIVLGGLFVDVYRDYFHFPRLRLLVDPGLLLMASIVSLAAGSVGALVAVRRAVGLAQAEAMRPEPPAAFHAGAPALGGWVSRLPASLRMILRHLVRRPWRALLSVLGMAFAIGLMVVGRFAIDAPNHMLAVQFNEVQRDDVTVLYNEPRGPAAGMALAKMDGVIQAEPFRLLPAWLRHGHRSKRIDVTGLVSGHELRRLLDAQLRPVELPPQGLVLTKKLAQMLDLAPGDLVTMEVLEGTRPVLQVPVVGLVDEMLGLGAYMDAFALARLLGEENTSSGAYLRIQADAAPGLYARLKRMPVVAGVAARAAVQRSMRETMDRAFFFFSAVLVLFSCVIIAGMVYNSARIALSERGNELASLAVLGFTQREVSFLLLGEQVLLLLAAMPVGLGLGYGLCALLVPMFDRELFRVPLVIGAWSYFYPVLAAAVASGLSGLLVARRIRSLDLIAVLKTRE
ncbi:ABC transporter permease [Rhodoferax sp.]|uniref:ABC transporter permease n=1 Tax=Rhodoferax sp. TaxID=50421 RepID=UPI002636B572|nr:ABC transporter permease [Rhodoferax sp.]MDD2924988.1 ABC transporter permease [Rhodoferax sp.]